MIIKKIKLSFPFADLLEALKNDELPFFLDSGSGYQNKLGKYSFMGASPIAVFKAKDHLVEIKESGTWRESKVQDSLESFESFYSKYSRKYESLFPFTGGLVGFFSYDLCHMIEKLPRTARDDKKIPDICFGVYDGVFVFDHQTEEVFVAAHGISEDAELIAERLCRLAEGYVPQKIDQSGYTGSFKDEKKEFISSFTKDDYLASVSKIRRYIKSGDIYQANLTQRFETDYSGDPCLLYNCLRRINPAPFASFFDFGDFQIVSSSPERFIKVEGSKIQTRPIKGTIARGKDQNEDLFNKQLLQSSEKDQSELLMIVDLARNDLGKISKTGTVAVEELFAVEEYPTVYHLVATITGELRDDVNRSDIIRAAFPGGSITGTPKIRAMEIIDEIEPVQRNIYTGSVGYIGFNGDLDLNIAIRTIILKDEKAFYQVGGAIVWDSEEEAEYQETLVKGKALRAVLGGAHNGSLA